MADIQTFETVTLDTLKPRVQELISADHRLVQIGCTRTPTTFEINYSFDKEYRFTNLRLTLTEQTQPIPSVSDITLPAFLYENELNDLFGLNIQGIAIDYKGGLYRTSVKHAFSQPPAGGKGQS